MGNWGCGEIKSPRRGGESVDVCRVVFGVVRGFGCTSRIGLGLSDDCGRSRAGHVCPPWKVHGQLRVVADVVNLLRIQPQIL